MEKLETVIFDIDGTLCDSFGEKGYNLGPLDWEALTEEMKGYPPNKAIVLIAEAFYHWGYEVVVASGRPERFRQLTKEWLHKHGIPFDRLLLRPEDSELDDPELKRSMLRELEKIGCEVMFVIDDRTSVVKMWRSECLVCLQCAQGDY